MVDTIVVVVVCMIEVESLNVVLLNVEVSLVVFVVPVKSDLDVFNVVSFEGICDEMVCIVVTEKAVDEFPNVCFEVLREIEVDIIVDITDFSVVSDVTADEDGKIVVASVVTVGLGKNVDETVTVEALLILVVGVEVEKAVE